MSVSRLLRASLAAAVAVTLLVSAALPAAAGSRYWGYEKVLDITFPVKGPTSYADWYWAPRSGGRVHQATDIMADKMQRVFAARGGIVCWITGLGERPPSYGMMVTICGGDGRRYSYVHLNNDRPGTDNNVSRPRFAYARGLALGSRVERGQFIGYVGDSGYAEDTAPHLHFEISDPRLRDRRIRKEGLDPTRLNPYRSLRRAERQGDYPGVLFPRR